ncbi:2-hydroxyacid dehydrogenase [Algihabitans albus]|uniref:2-hydroxyacid dehydrogenase n=1 Tax=Algihabitans albus TaxID=2164067 RepID=UPI000E5C61EA|nr:glyoxylate/hydroxypyruvate reductase A [Algihabitans albus]
MKGVLVSATLKLDEVFRSAFAAEDASVELLMPEEVDDPATIDFALAWRPPQGVLKRYPNLKVICSIAAGVDNILADPELPDVPVVRMVDPEQAEAMALFVIWHVIWYQRRFDLYLEQQEAQVWRRQPQRSATDTTVAVLGLGRMGSVTAQRLAGLGYPTLGWARSPRTLEGVEVVSGGEGLETLLARADVVINLLPLTAETRGLLDGALFARMKPGAYLIQMGRGPHLVERDLLAAVDSGHLAGASLDVFEQEPLPPGHTFWTHPRILVTPHCASDATADLVAVQTLAAARAALAGTEIPNGVNKTDGY